MSVFGSTTAMMVLLGSSVLASTDSVGRVRKMRVLREARKVVVKPLRKCALRGFVVKTRASGEWKSLPLLVTYSYDNHESKDMSDV